MKRMALAMIAALICATVGPLFGAAGMKEPLLRRAGLQQAFERGVQAVPALAAGLEDPNPIVRRTAARLLGRIEPLPQKTLAAALSNRDALVRRIALDRLADELADEGLGYLETALDDPSEMVRHTAVRRLIGLEPRTGEVRALLKQARADDDAAVARLAAEALWEFQRNVPRLSERPDWDYDVRMTQRIPLPAADWRFRRDPRSDGHVDRWYARNYDDSNWRRIAIEQAWQAAGIDYTGVAWYRRWIELPEKPELNAAEIRFEGIDESAWVWVNGVYVGDHDIGPEGWNQPFALDVTEELQWNDRNLIVVRAMNTKGNGGIWRPASIDVLK